MIEPLTAAASAAIAKIVLDKFYEGVGSKLGEKAIDAASAPIQKLSETVWSHCFKGNDKAKPILEAAGKGSPKALAKVEEFLNKQLEKEAIAQEIKPLAQQLQQVLIQIDDDSQMVQNNFGDGPVYMTKTGPNNTNFLGGTHHHTQQ